MHQKPFFWIFLFICVAAHASAFASSQDSGSGAETSVWEWNLIPKGRANRLAIADPREIGMGLNLGANHRLEAMIGNYFSLLSLESDEKNWKIFFGLEGAGYFSMRQEGAKFPLEHTDGLVGAYLEAAHGPWQFQLRYTHVSAHLADGSADAAITYSREYVTAKAGFVAGDILHAYAGSITTVNSTPSVPAWGFQTGMSIFPPWRFSSLSPFAAFDAKWRQEVEFNPSVNVQLGLALNHPWEPYRSFRIFYDFYSGADPRGQYFQRRRVAHSLGIEMQI